MFTYSMKFSLLTTSLVSGLGSLTIASSAIATTFPFPNVYGDVSFSENQAFITNAFSNGLDDSGNFNVSGNNPIFAFDLELELGLEDGALGFDSGDTSVISETFTARTGDKISFDWTFLTNHVMYESDRNDYAFVIINNGVSSLVDTNSSLTSPGLNGFAQQISDAFSYTFSTDGTYQIAVGVSDVGDDITSSALLVENFNYQPIPEPLTILGAGTALTFGTWFKRKIKR